MTVKKKLIAIVPQHPVLNASTRKRITSRFKSGQRMSRAPFFTSVALVDTSGEKVNHKEVYLTEKSVAESGLM